MSQNEPDHTWQPRDPARIDRMLTKLREMWLKCPQWRLGQIIYNAVRQRGELDGASSVYYIEDDEMEKLLVVLSASFGAEEPESNLHDRR